MMNRGLNIRSHCAFFIGIFLILAAPFIIEHLIELRYFQVRVNLIAQREALQNGLCLAGTLISVYGLIGYFAGVWKKE